MNKLAYKVGAAIAASTMLIATFSGSAFAATNTVTVSNSGPFSFVGVGITNKTKTIVGQINYTSSSVHSTVNQNTGGNWSLFNNGGSTTTTGGNSALVNTTVGESINTVTFPSCGCNTNSTTVGVTNNGPFSYTGVGVTNNSSTTVLQGNTTVSHVTTTVNQNSGNNASVFNNGGSTLTTGNNSTEVNTTVGGSENTVTTP